LSEKTKTKFIHFCQRCGRVYDRSKPSNKPCRACHGSRFLVTPVASAALTTPADAARQRAPTPDVELGPGMNPLIAQEPS
jgi:predicted  nucleic acid-binding Zn-ribbon protein